MEGQRALDSIHAAFFHFCFMNYCKVDHQPAGDGKEDGTVATTATKKSAEKVKTGRFGR
jgi:hypothetical protein